jgi:uncharacterized cupredoxin-like copper-binding protein
MNTYGVTRRFSDSYLESPMRITLMAAILALGLLALGVGLHRTSAQTPPATATVEIDAFDIFFKPNLGTVPADTPVQLVVTNHGAIGHNFSITDHRNAGLANLNVSFDIAPGETGTATINAPAGVYYFYCNVPGHEQAGMFGYLTVEKDASVTTSEATVTPRAG